MSFLRFYFYYILLHLSLTGSSFMQIGDAVSVKLDSAFSYTYSDNILKDNYHTKESDSFTTFTPGLEVTLGQSGRGVNFGINVGYAFNRYYKTDALDTELLQLSMGGTVVNTPSFKTKVNYSFAENQIASPSISNTNQVQATLIEINTESFAIASTYKFSPKLSLDLGVRGNKLEFDTLSQFFASKDSYTLPLRLTYEYSQKFDIFYGIDFTHRDVGPISYGLPVGHPLYSNGYESDSYYYNLGLKGDLLPKLSGSFSVGYRAIEFSSQSLADREALGLDSTLMWAISPKVNSKINILKTFDASGDGDTYNGLIINSSTSYILNPEYNAGFNYGFSEKKYIGRTDQMTTSGLTLSYIPSENYSITGGYYFTFSRSIRNYAEDQFRFIVDLKY